MLLFVFLALNVLCWCLIAFWDFKFRREEKGKTKIKNWGDGYDQSCYSSQETAVAFVCFLWDFDVQDCESDFLDIFYACPFLLVLF